MNTITITRTNNRFRFIFLCAYPHQRCLDAARLLKDEPKTLANDESCPSFANKTTSQMLNKYLFVALTTPSIRMNPNFRIVFFIGTATSLVYNQAAPKVSIDINSSIF